MEQKLTKLQKERKLYKEIQREIQYAEDEKQAKKLVNHFNFALKEKFIEQILIRSTFPIHEDSKLFDFNRSLPNNQVIKDFINKWGEKGVTVSFNTFNGIYEPGTMLYSKSLYVNFSLKKDMPQNLQQNDLRRKREEYYNKLMKIDEKTLSKFVHKYSNLQVIEKIEKQLITKPFVSSRKYRFLAPDFCPNSKEYLDLQNQWLKKGVNMDQFYYKNAHATFDFIVIVKEDDLVL